MQKILVIGASGMLGSMVLDVFRRANLYDMGATVREQSQMGHKKNTQYHLFDVRYASIGDITTLIANYDIIINCVGITKPHVKDDDIAQVNLAIEINANFPNRLAQAVKDSAKQVIQIATDCVYSGKSGGYDEQSYHDAYDVYGKSKSLGEALQDNFINLRSSIIGPEDRNEKFFLLEWFATQPKNTALRGFTNHDWNGITTLHFAKICLAIVKNNIKIDNIQHIIPGDIVNKYELLKIFQSSYHRDDITIEAFATDVVVNRTLSSLYQDINTTLWQGAGYDTPPIIAQMIAEIADYQFMD